MPIPDARGCFAPPGHRVLIAIGIAILMAVVPAQVQGQNGAYRLASIRFSGLNKFTEKQAAAGTGLRVGDPITTADLSVAADRLAKSGAFDKVAFQYSTLGNQLTAIFTVVENRQLLPCLFDNFVWFSDEQLDKTLRAHVPLFGGITPVSGGMEQEIIDALRDLLKANGIAADVQPIPSPGPSGTGKVMLFRVVGISMPIKSASFPGASAISEKELETAATGAIGQDFSIANMSDFASATLVPFYHQRGYLRAAFSRPEWSIIGSPAEGAAPDVALTLRVKEGSQYFWDKAEWSGNHQMTNEQMEQALGMKQGEVANEQKIEDGFKAIRDGYGKIGYIDARVQPRVSLDDSKSLAAYAVNIDEGVQYHMGRVIFLGVPEKAAADLASKWQLKAGAVYDGSYAEEFVDKVALRRLSEMGIKKTKATFSFRRDRQNATVDVNVVFP